MFDLKQNLDGSHKVQNEYVLKQGSKNSIEINFKVHNDIVYGLKYFYLIKKGSVIIEKDDEVIGSYPPTVGKHTYVLKEEEVPSGWLKRSTYQGK